MMTSEVRQTTATDVHVADRLVRAIRDRGAPACVGLDPVLERIPDRTGSDLDTIRAFCGGVLEACAGIVPAVKVQSACFERYGAAGVEVRDRVLATATELGFVTILDAKRGDIGVSAAHYAHAAFRGAVPVDWLTVNAYLGADGLTPFLEAGGGIFALVRTSNPGGDALQTQRLEGGGTVADTVARLVADLGASFRGTSGMSALGAVVGATKGDELARLRALMPDQPLLVPGYGAQGGGVDDVRPLFGPDGVGALVTASRSVIYAEPRGGTWTDAVRDAARRLADELGSAAGLR
jgi:orotidine-5'-phosphate decarboxylase